MHSWTQAEFKRRTREADGGCIEWTGPRVSFSLHYGAAYKNNICILAHRLSWILFKGEIPSKQCVLHRCDNPICVNPDHLYLGTQTDNMLDVARRRRHANIKLSDADYQLIRNSKEPSRALARRYGLNKSTVLRIKSGTYHKYLTTQQAPSQSTE